MATAKKSNEVDKYIDTFPKDVQARLQSMRKTILKEVPDAEEKIGYGIPTYKVNGKNLVHFGGWKDHVGFYPAPSGLTAFEKELSKYAASKGSVRFPHEQPLPLSLVTKIVKFRLKENEAKAKTNAKVEVEASKTKAKIEAKAKTEAKAKAKKN
ncbi:MAG TPA: DUF1801 domain-containing protein [Saprospiraceae bacterium]|nr:DUF1801 domain-containing protein [Saprospiraceae bacterium]